MNIRRKSHKVIILGDSHAIGIANEIQCKLGKNFEILGIVKPGAKIKEIANSLDSTVRSYTKRDVCIIWGDARDVAKNEREQGLGQMKKVVSNMNHTNLVIITVPHRHDLHESSCVNNAIKTFNRKLTKHVKAFDNQHVVEVESAPEVYTNHGMHLNGKGKEWIANKIMKIIKDIINVKQLTPIEMKWEKEESVGDSNLGRCDSVEDENGMNQEDPKNDSLGNNGQDSDLVRCENSTTKQARASKRLERPPTNKKVIFYSRR
jgi:hypothetical protein